MLWLLQLLSCEQVLAVNCSDKREIWKSRRGWHQCRYLYYENSEVQKMQLWQSSSWYLVFLQGLIGFRSWRVLLFIYSARSFCILNKYWNIGTLCICTLVIFLVLLFSYSTAGNAYSAGRQWGYSVAPVNLCKSLLSAFAEGNLHFQMHEIDIYTTIKPVWRVRVSLDLCIIPFYKGLVIDLLLFWDACS